MAVICRQIEERVEETVWEPVEEWVERRVEKCKQKKCKKWCLCCNKWFCWIETFLERVITWVVKTIVNFVVRTVCEVMNDFISVVVDIFEATLGIIWDFLNIVWNIITWDWDDVKKHWNNLLAHLIDLFVGILDSIMVGIRYGTGLFIVGYVREKVNRHSLREYVRDRLNKKFRDNLKLLENIKERINLDHGAFGLEFRSQSYRTFVDSKAENPPFLLELHQSGSLNIYELAGIEPGNILDRPEVEARLVANGTLSREDIDEYIASQGEKPYFRIFAMSKGSESEKLEVAEDKARDIGIKLRWTSNTIEVSKLQDIDVDKDRLNDFLEVPIGRDPNGTDVGTLAAAGVFTIRPMDGSRPFGWTKRYSPDKGKISGLIHRDRKPAGFFKYVLIHEIGHYFSLEHKNHDGLDKIMYSPRENSWWSWNLITEFLLWSGEPRFTLDDGKKAWDFIIDEISQCLTQ